jgi:hypothetical protein
MVCLRLVLGLSSVGSRRIQCYMAYGFRGVCVGLAPGLGGLDYSSSVGSVGMALRDLVGFGM